MIYRKIKKDFTQCDASHLSRWIQRLVLINKEDVNQYNIGNGNISFKLKEEKRGFHYEYSNVLFQVLGNYEAENKFNYFQYKHNVQLPLSGFGFETKAINDGEYFAALLDYENRVWIFGFEYGLKPPPYLFESNELNTLTLSSVANEDDLPLRYIIAEERVVEDSSVKDFYNDFADIDLIELNGQFSDDFNNDFLI